VREIRLADGKVIELGGARANIGNDELPRRAVRAGVLCNEAVIDPRATDDSQNMGDPTEIALLTAARGLGVDAQ
jgi:magnesium-transporting ATPase (P-type)